MVHCGSGIGLQCTEKAKERVQDNRESQPTLTIRGARDPDAE